MRLKNRTDNCDEQRLTAYLDDALSAATVMEVEEHLSACGDCRDLLERSAGDRAQWTRARRLLQNDRFDREPTPELFPRGEYDGERKPVEADMLAREIQGWLDPTDDPESLGRFAGYEIAGVVGHGGMGIVLKGFEAALNRHVAIKVLAPRMATNGAARKRFAREAQATAAVRHDNVIAIHCVDEWHGLPFLVMPYIAGVSLQKRIDAEGPLSIEQTLRVGVQIAAGLAAAHAQGLVHRDIKPANILLERGVERVTITDFGLARAADDASMTRTGVIAGTPQYMSPEQAEAKPLAAASDLFSLGSVLYTMATGRAPFRGSGSFEVLKRIVSEPARRMREIEPTVPQWFEQLVGQLHAKSPEQRSTSAEEVADQLRECLAHVRQPETAPLPNALAKPSDVRPERETSQMRLKPPSFQIGRVFGVLAMFAAIPLGILGMLLWQSTSPPDIAGKWVGEQWGRVELKESKPGTYVGASSDKERTFQLKWSRVERRFNGGWQDDAGRKGKISVRLVGDQVQGAWTTNKQSNPKPETPRLADLLWTRRTTRPATSPTTSPTTQPRIAALPATFPGHQNYVNSVVFSPDGRIVAAADAAGAVFLWDVSTQRKLRSLDNTQVLQCVDFSPDGKTLVTADRGWTIAFWDVATGREISRFKEHDSVVMSVTYSPEGDLLASAGVDKSVKIWESASGEVRRTLTGHENAIQEVVFSRDGTKIASVDLDGKLKIWDTAEGELLSDYKIDRSGMGLSFSPDGKTIATANYPPKIQLLDVATGRVLRTMMGHRSRVRDVAFSVDGRVLASAGDDKTIRLWDVASGRQIGMLSGHSHRVHDVEFSPDGKMLVSGGADKTSKLW
ncbi:MAG: protein kinase, partial [Pirellulaceae bacterium]|nr:protein kinase [Pirellulaceae bacterium]